MKKTIKYAVLVLAVFFLESCCHKVTETDKLAEIDSLTYHNPDSAVRCLEILEDSVNSSSIHAQMYYRLLTIKAKDKAYITHTSDSLILSVISYYEKADDKCHLPEAYYYGGRVYADLYDAPKALEYYQKQPNYYVSLQITNFYKSFILRWGICSFIKMHTTKR